MGFTRVGARFTTACDLLRKAGPGRLIAGATRVLGRRRPVVDVAETAIAHRALRASGLATGTLIDVGAFGGGALAPFLQDGWEVHAFEPDDRNRSYLVERFGGRANLKVVPEALSEEPRESASYYVSPEHPGISSLAPFDSTHAEGRAVRVTTLAIYCERAGLREVDAIKVDAEGHDMFVLRGAPPGLMGARIVICEFEDSKTLPLGYRSRDLRRLLEREGFEVYVSEWYPIDEYGRRHVWRRFLGPGSGEPDPAGWGNFIAVRSRGLARSLARELRLTARGLR